jgi:hypothetical protein
LEPHPLFRAFVGAANDHRVASSESPLEADAAAGDGKS